MKFMIIVTASNNSEAEVMPSEELLTALGKYNEELAKPAWCSRPRAFIRRPRARARGLLETSAVKQ